LQNSTISATLQLRLLRMPFASAASAAAATSHPRLWMYLFMQPLQLTQPSGSSGVLQLAHTRGLITSSSSCGCSLGIFLAGAAGGGASSMSISSPAAQQQEQQ
jgi:hypothetical protein